MIGRCPAWASLQEYAPGGHDANDNPNDFHCRARDIACPTTRPLDRSLGSGKRPILGIDRKNHGAAEPGVLHPIRTCRVLSLGRVVGDGAVHAPAPWGFSVADKFLITTLPAAIGSFVRLPYTFAIAKFGGRNWTVISAVSLLVPSVLAIVVLKPGISLGETLLVAALFGIGGGNFASSMANINNFYPQRLKGWALGLNAGGGNIGVATVQIVGLLIIASHAKSVDPRVVLYIYVPLIMLVATLAWFNMDNLSEATNDKGAMREVAKRSHTWIISFLYIGTFGSFIGFGFAFGQVLAASGVKALRLLRLDRRLRRLARPPGRRDARRSIQRLDGVVLELRRHGRRDRRGVPHRENTFAAAVHRRVHRAVRAHRDRKRLGVQDDPGDLPRRGHRQATAAVSRHADFQRPGRRRRRDRRLRRVLVQIAFRQSFLSFGTGNAAYLAFIVFYTLCAIVTWTFYIRTNRAALIAV